MPILVESKVKGEVYSHRVLWRAARLHAQSSGAGTEGAVFSRLSAITMAFATVEAYANFLLHIFDPDRYEHERTAFKGVAHKISEVMNLVGLNLDPAARPYSTVLSIKTTRDRIMHAKPDVYSEVKQHTAAEEPPSMTNGELETLTAPERVSEALEDVHRFCVALHAGAVTRAGDDERNRIRLENSALCGSYQTQTIASTVVSGLQSRP